MPVYTIEAPDGRKIKVEAASPENAMKAAQEYAEANPAKPKADGDVSSGYTLGNVARAVTRGIPFLGGYRDEIAAGVQSTLMGRDYDEALAKERARDKAFQGENPIGDFALGAAGGVGGTIAALPAVGGAGVLGAAGRTALGVGARTLPGAIGRGAVAGTLQGAAAGSGHADEGGFVNRAMGGIQGGAIGGTIGALVPAAVGGVGALGRNFIDRVRGQGGPLSDLSGGARRYVGEISDPAKVAQMQQELARLGPDAMLADVSPEWQMVARGAAARPGSRDTVVNALSARDAGKNARLGADLDASLGRAVVPSEVEAGLAAGREGLGPQYGANFQGARAVDTQPLADQLDAALVNLRGESRRALERVRGWLNIPGTNQLDPNPGALFQVRQEIDGLLATEQNPRVIANLTATRQEVDRMLARSVPGLKGTDAQFQELARQSEGLRRGGQVLDSGKTAVRPQELAQEVQQGVLPQGTMVGPSGSVLRMQQGTRAEIDRVAGQNANDPVALQRLVKGEGDWNREKLGTLFGRDRADSALGAIDREVTFRNTHTRVTAGSDTAAGQGFKEFLDKAERPITGASGGTDITAMGLAVNTSRRIGQMLTGALGKQRANRFATELAQAAIAQGVTRDQFVQALTQAGVKQQQISRMLDYATRGGLILSREVPPRMIEAQ